MSRFRYQSSDEEEEMNFKHQPKKKIELPKFNQINFNQETIQFEGIKFSVSRLKKKLTLGEIKQIYQSIKDIRRYQGFNPQNLDTIPYEALSAIDQYNGKQYRLMYICFKNNVPFHQRIIKSPFVISHINFPNLQILRINNLMICNIESLNWVEAPNLRCLELYQNKITKLNTLNKAHLPKLQIITFYQNPISQIQRFYRLNSKKLTGYEFDSKYTNDFILQDYRFLLKMQNPRLKMLKVQDQKRIDLRERPAFKILNQPGTKITYYQKPVHIYRRPYIDDNFHDFDDDVLD